LVDFNKILPSLSSLLIEYIVYNWNCSWCKVI